MSDIHPPLTFALFSPKVIRSVPGAPQNWSTNHRRLSDSNLSVYSTIKALDRWLSCSLEALGNFMVFLAAMASVALSRAGRVTSGSAGWGLTQSLAITGLMAWAVRNLTNLESNMLSVIRVSELTDLDPQSPMPRELSGSGEALKALLPDESSKVNITLAPLNEKALVEDGWPWRGNVQFSNTSMRYNPYSPLVLKGVDLSVPAGTTLGVVGRTGSGTCPNRLMMWISSMLCLALQSVFCSYT